MTKPSMSEHHGSEVRDKVDTDSKLAVSLIQFIGRTQFDTDGMQHPSSDSEMPPNGTSPDMVKDYDSVDPIHTDSKSIVS